MTVSIVLRKTPSLSEAGEAKDGAGVEQSRAVFAGLSGSPGRAWAAHEAAFRPRAGPLPALYAVTSLCQRPCVPDLVYVTSHA